MHGTIYVPIHNVPTLVPIHFCILLNTATMDVFVSTILLGFSAVFGTFIFLIYKLRILHRYIYKVRVSSMIHAPNNY